MSIIEDQTIDHLFDELVHHLDLTIIVDKLLSNNLISAETLEILTNLLRDGRTNDAVRKAILMIRRNPPGYLDTFIKVLQSEDRSKHCGDAIRKGIFCLTTCSDRLGWVECYYP